jgi:hypothetical protein
MQRTGKDSRIGDFIQILEASVEEKILRLVKSRGYQIKKSGPHDAELLWNNSASESLPYNHYAIWGNRDSEQTGITKLPDCESAAVLEFLEMTQSAAFVNFQTRISEAKRDL